MRLKTATISTLATVVACGTLLNGFAYADTSDLSDSYVLDTYDAYSSIVQDDPEDLSDEPISLWGDLNLDSSFDCEDLLLLKKSVLGVSPSVDGADLNLDGSVNVLDYLTLEQALIPSAEDPADKKTICLDAGHYGFYNRSPGVSDYYESSMTWKLHLYLKEELEAYGFNVVTTRETQEGDRELFERGQCSMGCDLFISIHSNAVGSYMDESTDFPMAVVLLPDDSTDIDEVSAEVGALLADTIAETMQTKQSGRTVTRRSDNDRNGDGVLNDEWYRVMYGAKSVGTPAILLEHSFHTNTRSARWMLDEDNLRTLAKAEAKTIAEYFGLA
jgi:N-acetylmuramoyl-L-alanine amidase